MEPMTAISEGDQWSSLSGMYTAEEADFMAQLLGNRPLPIELDGGGSNIGWTGHAYNYSDVANPTSFSQGNTYSILFPSSSSQEQCCYLSDSHHPILVTNSSSMSMNFCMGDAANTSSYLIEADDCLNQEMNDGNVEEQAAERHQESLLPSKNLEPKSKPERQEQNTEDKSNTTLDNSKKRSRISSGDIQKNKRNVRSKKNQKSVPITRQNEEVSTGTSPDGQNLSSCSTEDDSSGSQELNGESAASSSKGQPALNLKGKIRASRGVATDPQILYAGKRRERINERLKILQNLVPNGTKVDISTMLEEAVQYVKFLQLQIKLLSSDDLWMYPPIAYNGMNIGLDLKLNMARRT